MTALRERNQASVGLVALVLVVLATLTAYFSDRLPLIDQQTSYAVAFAEAAGLKAGNEVQIAGVKVGAVRDTALDGDTVRVTFAVDPGTRIGDRSTASIEIKTLLGEKFLALRPQGTHPQDPREEIGVARTRTPFQIQDVFTQLSHTVGQLDTVQLARSFDTLSDTFRDTPPAVRSTLTGLSSLSRTIASRDSQLATLLADTKALSATLAGRRDQIQRIAADGNLLLTEISQRRNDIHGLLVGTQQLATQLSGLVNDNKATLAPTLRQFGTVTALLQRNQDNLDAILHNLAAFSRLGVNTTGNGRWFDGYLCGLIPPAVTAGGFTVNPQGCTPPIAAPGQGINGTGGGR